MQPEDIIKQFEVYVDDLTELSTDEEYLLLTKVLQSVYNDRSWEFLRKTASVSVNGTTGTLPVDFVSVMNNYSENDYNSIPEIAVAYVGGIPYRFIPRGIATMKKGNTCYIDLANKQIVFTQSIGSQTVTFDYKYRPDPITSNLSEIALPEDFRRYIPQVMAIDDDIIQKTERARSNQQINLLARKELLRDLAHYDMRFQNY